MRVWQCVCVCVCVYVCVCLWVSVSSHRKSGREERRTTSWLTSWHHVLWSNWLPAEAGGFINQPAGPIESITQQSKQEDTDLLSLSIPSELKSPAELQTYFVVNSKDQVRPQMFWRMFSISVVIPHSDDIDESVLFFVIRMRLMIKKTELHRGVKRELNSFSLVLSTKKKRG